MHKRNPLLALLILGAVSACTGVTMPGHTVKEDSAPVRGATVQPAQPLITRLILDYTPAAQQQTVDEAKFSAAELNRIVGQGLAARGLADLANSAVVRVAAIEVDEFDVRATSNMVLMGRVASAGVLGGRVRIRDGSGTQLREFHVRAEAAMKLVHSSTDRNALDDLYRKFASLIADELTDTVRRPPAQAR